MPLSSSSLHRRAAFTLVELLVAAAITLLLVSLLMTAAQSILSGYTRTQAGIVRQSNMSFALDQLVLDLEGIVIPNASGSEGLRISFEDVHQSMGVPWITFLSTAIDKDTSEPVQVHGATRAVSYRMAFQRSIEGENSFPETYGIYRSIASSAHTFQNALNLTNLQTDYWTTLEASPTPIPLQPAATGNLLAENVVDFSVLFQYKNGSWTLPTDRVSIRRDGTFVNEVAVDGGFIRAQVSVTALTPEGANRLQDGSVPFEEVVKRFGTTVLRQTAFF